MSTSSYFLELNKIDASLEVEIFLKQINFSFETGKNYAIMGETGSGKTLLAKIMAGLEPVVNGSVIFQGEVLRNPLELLIPGHPKIAYLSQYFEVPKNYIVKDYLDFENQIDELQVEHIKSICKIQHLQNRKTQAMSGGEKQRVALAKKFMLMPELLILDEPFAHLDYANRQIMKSVINDYIKNYHANSILITHDAADVFERVDTLLILQNGCLIASGSPKDFYNRPSSMYVAQLLGPCFSLPVEDLCLYMKLDTTSNAEIMLRPDFFEITDGEGDFSGIVKESTFNGFLHVITIEMPNLRQIKLYNHHDCPKGTIVKVQFRPNFLHFIY